MKSILCLFSLLGLYAHADVFVSNIPAQASSPQKGVSGDVYFQTFEGTPGKRIANCVLVHGHGTTQELMEFVARADGMGLKGASLEGLGVAAEFVPELAARVERLANLDVIQAFGYFYFGETLIKGLLSKACDSVTMILQESSQSTILEMTARTERFLKSHACARSTIPGQIGCAVVGHSKGGAVATAILRRCAEAIPRPSANAPLIQGGSELGEFGCNQLGEVYSAGGVTEGVGLPIAIAGARRLPERQKQMEKLTMGLVDMTQQFEDGLRKLQPLKDAERRFNLDIFGEKTADTNPLWYDLNPINEMDGYGEADRKVGVPIGVRQGPGFIPSKSGWLRSVDYAAAGGYFRFDKAQYISSVVDGLKLWAFDPAGTYTLSVGNLPKYVERPKVGKILRDIIGAGPRDPSKKAPLETMLDFLWEPFIKGQRLAGDMMTQKMGEIHGDPQLAMMLQWGIEDSTKYAKAHSLTDKAGKTDYLSRFKFQPVAGAKAEDGNNYVQVSDGFVETNVAIGACERGKTVPAVNRVTKDCKFFDRTNHLGVTGMSTDVAAHIIEQLEK